MKFDDMKIAYEPHPVSAERKAELRGQGYRIIDVRFKPADAEDESPKAETESKPKTRRKASTAAKKEPEAPKSNETKLDDEF